MRPRFEFSPKGLFVALGVLLAIGLLASLPGRDGSIADGWLIALWLASLMVGSAVVIVRMWRTRGRPDKFWRAAHGNQLAFLPPKWRRWVLGETEHR